MLHFSVRPRMLCSVSLFLVAEIKRIILVFCWFSIIPIEITCVFWLSLDLNWWLNKKLITKAYCVLIVINFHIRELEAENLLFSCLLWTMKFLWINMLLLNKLNLKITRNFLLIILFLIHQISLSEATFNLCNLITASIGTHNWHGELFLSAKMVTLRRHILFLAKVKRIFNWTFI